MTKNAWEANFLIEEEAKAWELFHENSKLTRYSELPSNEEVVLTMKTMYESLPFTNYPEVKLPPPELELKLALAEALSRRCTARDLMPGAVALHELSTILYYAYGITRPNEGSNFPRPFRTAPSGGALYPLELFFHTTQVGEIDSGLYHYNPTRNGIRLLRQGDATACISEALVQSELPSTFSLLIFVTALFQRSVFKYGDRGYRFVLLEAGHVAQNINLAASGLGFGSVNIGGFFDHEVDDFLDLNGVTHSTIYLVGIGKSLQAA
jgi:SagB-type dehydrogenase family enzyme